MKGSTKLKICLLAMVVRLAIKYLHVKAYIVLTVILFTLFVVYLILAVIEVACGCEEDRGAFLDNNYNIVLYIVKAWRWLMKLADKEF